MDSEEYKKLNNALFQRYVVSKDTSDYGTIGILKAILQIDTEDEK